MIIELRELSLDDGRDVWELIREIGPGENGFTNAEYDMEYADFSKYLKERSDMAHGRGIDLDRYVPQTTYSLIVNGRSVGLGKLRHYLNDYLMKIGGHIGYTIRPSERGKGYGNLILKELLKKAREKGISKVLLTCRESNAFSRKVIEKNGGDLESVTDGECRYWIRTL